MLPWPCNATMYCDFAMPNFFVRSVVEIRVRGAVELCSVLETFSVKPFMNILEGVSNT